MGAVKLLRGVWGSGSPRGHAPSLADLALLKGASKRALNAAESATRWFTLPGGRTLFDVGDPAEEAYFLMAGALVAHRPSQRDDEIDIIGHIRPGEPVGEMAMLSDEPHTTAVTALRDSELLALSRKDFFRLARAHPEFWEGMSRLILLRSRAQRTGKLRTQPKVFALFATSPSIDPRYYAEALSHALGSLGKTVVIVGEEAGEKPTGWFDELEQNNDVVILTARIADTAWYRICLRQADRLWVLARRDARPSRPMPLAPDPASPARRFRLVDMVILPLGAPVGARPVEWVEEVGAARIFHWRDDRDARRLARVMAGLSVGVVLSGGGARAYAHIGALRAIKDAGLPIDFIGGTSMGAIIGAGVALGWDVEEITERVYDAFVRSNPLGDFRLPVIALAAGGRVEARLLKHFGEARIEEMPKPFFAVSSNLSTGAAHVHRTGLVRDALRASIALPGILPPVVTGGEVLVDGAVLDNFPVDVMQSTHRGPILGVDVARQGSLRADDYVDAPGFIGWVRRHGVSDPPPIASLLIRAATVHMKPWHGREAVDLLIAPELRDIEIRDWRSFEPAIEAGYIAATAALEEPNERLAASAEAARKLGESD